MRVLIIFLFFLVSFLGYGKEEQFDYKDAVTLGLIQGVTEFLPVSSTGHLLLANHFLKLDADDPVMDANGLPLVTKAKPGKPSRFITFKDVTDNYAVLIQLGTIVTLLVFFRRRVIEILIGCIGLHKKGLYLGRNLVIAFLPAGLLGFVIDGALQKYLYNPLAITGALAAGAIFILFTEHQRLKKIHRSHYKTNLEDLHWTSALLIGLLQCVAFWPGISRSMMTIIGGFFVGLTAVATIEFSFLLGLLVQLASTGYKIVFGDPVAVTVLGWPSIATGCIVAAISGAIVIPWFIHFLTHYGLRLFAYYRILLSAILLYIL